MVDNEPRITITSADGQRFSLGEWRERVITSDARKEHATTIVTRAVKARMHYVTKGGAQATVDLLQGVHARNREGVLKFVWELIAALREKGKEPVKLHFILSDRKIPISKFACSGILKKLEKLGVVKTEAVRGDGTIIYDRGISDPKFGAVITAPVTRISPSPTGTEEKEPEGPVVLGEPDQLPPIPIKRDVSVVLDISDLSDPAKRLIAQIIELDNSGLIVNRSLKLVLEK